MARPTRPKRLTTGDGRVSFTGETVSTFAELGVHRLVPTPRPDATEADIDALMGEAAARSPARRRLSGRLGNEDRDDPVGLLLVLVVGRVHGGGPSPPLG